MIRRAIPIGVLLLLIASPAFAATSNVTIVDFAFNPSLTRLKMGDTVTWTNTGNAVHNSRGDGPLGLWSAPPLSAGQSFSFTFTAAGMYPYRCRFHPALMTGTVVAPEQAQPPSGPVGTAFTIIVATVPARHGFVYDIQKKDPGGQFLDWMVGITSATAQFDSTGQPTGTYMFRSRLRRLSSGGASGYSPAAVITVTT